MGGNSELGPTLWIPKSGPPLSGLLVVQASGSRLPFRGRSFNLVFLVTVLGEIPDKRAAMAEFARVLAPAGVLAVTEALPDPDYVRTPVLRRLAGRAGFEVAERRENVACYTQRLRRP
jgi:ubiquinone/menaquinone biosynthesis C-methylase UbiE